MARAKHDIIVIWGVRMSPISLEGSVQGIAALGLRRVKAGADVRGWPRPAGVTAWLPFASRADQQHSERDGRSDGAARSAGSGSGPGSATGPTDPALAWISVGAPGTCPMPTSQRHRL